MCVGGGGGRLAWLLLLLRRLRANETLKPAAEAMSTLMNAGCYKNIPLSSILQKGSGSFSVILHLDHVIAERGGLREKVGSEGGKGKNVIVKDILFLTRHISVVKKRYRDELK